MNEYIGWAPLLSISMKGDGLYVYLSVSKCTVSFVLVRKDSRVYRPVYYVSKAFRGVEAWYPKVEKLALALVTIARKLRHTSWLTKLSS